MDLKTYQALWKESLEQPDTIIANSQKLGISADFLKLYYELIQGHYESPLEKIYPYLARLLQIDWNKWAKEYYNEFSPVEWELNELARNFPHYLSKLSSQNKIPDYLVELAHYEWQEFATYVDEENEKEILTNIKPGYLALNPTVSALTFKYNIGLWIFELEKNNFDTKPKKEDNILIFNRDPETLLCIFTKASRISLSILQLLLEFNEPIEKEDLISNIMSNFNDIDKQFLVDEIAFLQKQRILLG